MRDRSTLRCLLGLLVLALAAPLPVSASQDLVVVAPGLAKVEYEDARVRVVRLRIPEQGTVPMHDRPRRVVVSLTANEVRLTRADGTSSITRTQAGTVAWSEPTVRTVANLGGALENVVIELKQAPEATQAASGPSAAAPERYLDDPLHRWVFENQYVRVYDVRIPPGGTTTFHCHAYDQVMVYVSGGKVSVQMEGQRWQQPVTLEPRSVAFSADAAKPIVHRVRNDDAGEYHTILVQFLR